MASMVVKAKTQAWEEFSEVVELRFGSALKRFQQTVRQLRRGKQLSAHTMYSEDIVLLISTENIVRGWKE